MHKLIHFKLLCGQHDSVDNSTDILSRLLNGAQRDLCLIPSRGKKKLFILWSLHTGSGAQPISYSTYIQSSFTGSKAAGAWTWPSPLSSTTVKIHCTVFPLRFSLREVHRDKFIYALIQSEKWRDVLRVCSLDIWEGQGCFSWLLY